MNNYHGNTNSAVNSEGIISQIIPMKQPTLPTHIEKALDERFGIYKLNGYDIVNEREANTIKQWFAQTLETEVKKAVEVEREKIKHEAFRLDEWKEIIDLLAVQYETMKAINFKDKVFEILTPKESL